MAQLDFGYYHATPKRARKGFRLQRTGKHARGK